MRCLQALLLPVLMAPKYVTFDLQVFRHPVCYNAFHTSELKDVNAYLHSWRYIAHCNLVVPRDIPLTRAFPATPMTASEKTLNMNKSG